MATTAILDLKLKQDGLEQTHAAIAQALGDTRAYDGCLGADAYVDDDDPSHVILVETWAQRADQERYMQWRQGTGVLDAMSELLERPIAVALCSRLGE